MQKKATEVGGIPERVTEQCEEWTWVLLWDDPHYPCMVLSRVKSLNLCWWNLYITWVTSLSFCMFSKKWNVWFTPPGRGMERSHLPEDVASRPRCAILLAQRCCWEGRVSPLLSLAAWLPGFCHTSAAALEQLVTPVWPTWSQTHWKIIIWSSSLSLDLRKAGSSMKRSVLLRLEELSCC